MFTDSNPPSKPKVSQRRGSKKTTRLNIELLDGLSLKGNKVRSYHHPELDADFHGVVLFSTETETPFVASAVEPIIVGRRDPRGRIEPTIDLTPIEGERYGVSRRHAEISLIENRYYIQDMGSTNGTWVNHLLLAAHHPYPLDDGVVVRFGRLSFLVELIHPRND